MSEPVVDRDKLRQKVQYIHEALRRLNAVRSAGRQAFLSDDMVQAASIRYLQVAIEAMVDAANHIVAREGLGLPRTYRQSLEILVREGILPPERRDAFGKMVGFRNRVVHLYDDVDPGEVYDIIEGRLGDFEAFLSAVCGRYLTA